MIILLILFVITIIFSKIKLKTIITPLTFYLIFWIFWLGISRIGIPSLYEVSEKTYFLLYLNVFMFVLGYMMFCKKNTKITEDVKEYKNESNMKFECLFLIIIMGILSYYLLKYNNLLNIHGVSFARTLNFEIGYLFNSAIEHYIFNLIITPIIYIFILRSIIEYIIFNKRNNIFYILSIVNVILYSLIGYGRMIYFDILIFVIIALILKRIIISKKDKKQNNNRLIINISILALIIFLSVFIMSILTAKRMNIPINSINNLILVFKESIKQLIVYFIGPFRALDYFLTNNFANFMELGLGRATFLGIDEIINSLLSLFRIDYNSIVGAVTDITVNPIFIGENQQFNAFYTCVMNFYIDGRALGVAIFAFIYGASVSVAMNCLYKNRNIYKICFVVYFAYTSIASIYRLNFLATNITIMVFLLILSQKYKVIVDKNILKGEVKK